VRPIVLTIPLCTFVACSAGEGASPTAEVPEPTFVGRDACVECHALETELWTDSHHDLAMQLPTPETVLGDFDDALFEHQGVVSRFHRDGERFLVDTEGADGEQATFEVDYVFGVYPLQQFLIAFPGGRLQCLGVAWDSRPVEEGGQRWFHLYPDEEIPAGDELHWTGPNQRWNFMCANCHSTGVRRGYDGATDSYETTWEELDVSCEACHGPASGHLVWAREENPGDPTRGLVISLDDPAAGQWALDPDADSARRTVPRGSRDQVETCARCHSRRSELREAPVDGQSYLDHYRLALLDEGLYYADGQVLEEVYVYGSFLQARMYGMGVTCGDCHESHTAGILFEGNELCARCHRASTFDTPEHHYHTPGEAGSFCVDCHMPERTYMVVDPRRDHSLRVPRPDLTLELGAPNACGDCHAEQGAEWAAEEVARWFPEGRQTTRHYGHALHAARSFEPGAAQALLALVTDDEVPAIARATGLSLIGPYLPQLPVQILIASLADDEALVRAAALGALEALPLRDRVPLAIGALRDPVLAVRCEAARILAPLETQSLPDELAAELTIAIEEYVASQHASFDRADARTNLGVLALDRGRVGEAQASFRSATELDPHFQPAWVNLADLHRGAGREDRAEEVLREAQALHPQSAVIEHSLGLLLVRTGRRQEAIESLGRAAALDPDQSRYAYVHGVALHSVERIDEALSVLTAASRRHPNDGDLLMALATILRDAERPAEGLPYAERLLELIPGNPGVEQLVEELRAAADR